MTASMTQIESTDARELAGILSAYTQVTERLQDSHAKLTAEVARLRGELASKDRQLERRSRLAALGEMAAGMAHEIRNPLGGVALYASLLMKQLTDRPESRTLAERISRGVDRLNGIVTDILAFAGEMTPRRQKIRLAAVAGEAAELARGRLDAAGAQLSCEVADAELQADPALLVRALSNLLFNAADAAGGGEVRLSGGAGEAGVYIAVADSGAGIEPAAMDKLFNPFFTTKGSGTGLGLAIVHRIVESHGGQIAARNAAPGGAEFTITLPQAG